MKHGGKWHPLARCYTRWVCDYTFKQSSTSTFTKVRSASVGRLGRVWVTWVLTSHLNIPKSLLQFSRPLFLNQTLNIMNSLCGIMSDKQDQAVKPMLAIPALWPKIKIFFKPVSKNCRLSANALSQRFKMVTLLLPIFISSIPACRPSIPFDLSNGLS